MKILLIALPTTFETKVPLLEAAGHEVMLVTGRNTEEISINLALSPDATNYVLGIIESFSPDIVINAVTTILIPHLDIDFTYVGNTAESSQLEINKWSSRTKAGELGWLLPTLLEECKMNNISDYDRTVYVKPKEASKAYQIFKRPNTLGNTNYDIIQSSSDAFNDIMTNLGLSDTDAYVEDSVDYVLEAWCFFTISNGSYSIIRTLGCTGCGDDKLPNANGDWTTGDITLLDLNEEQRTAFITKCEAWLDYAVTCGGNYEGTIGGAITADNSVYWFEQNSRPCTYNIGMLPGTIQDWIDGLTIDSTKSIHQISAETIRTAKGFG